MRLMINSGNICAALTAEALIIPPAPPIMPPPAIPPAPPPAPPAGPAPAVIDPVEDARPNSRIIN